MRLARALTAVLALVLVPALWVPGWTMLAFPTASLQRQGGDLFDDWQVCRTAISGEHGFFQEDYAGWSWPP